MEDLAAAEAELDAVEHALERLDDGTYGSCEVCRDPLDDARLAEADTVDEGSKKEVRSYRCQPAQFASHTVTMLRRAGDAAF